MKADELKQLKINAGANALALFVEDETVNFRFSFGHKEKGRMEDGKMKTKKERIKKLSELALTMYLSDSDYLDPKLDPKFKAAYKRIWYYAEKELQKNFRKGVSESDKAEVDKIMRKFLEDTGWNRRGKKIHALTFASFLADITDRYSPGIPFALNLLSEQLEEEPGGKQLCYNAGKTAAEKWKKIFDPEKK